MKRKKKERSKNMREMGLGEALARHIQIKPSGLEETLGRDVLERDARIKQRVDAARQEIEDGGRPRKGRFRL